MRAGLVGRPRAESMEYQPAFRPPQGSVLMPVGMRFQVGTAALDFRLLRFRHTDIRRTTSRTCPRVIAHPQRGTVNLLKKRQKRPKRHRSTLLTLVCSALSITSARGRERHPKPTAQV